MAAFIDDQAMASESEDDYIDRVRKNAGIEDERDWMGNGQDETGKANLDIEPAKKKQKKGHDHKRQKRFRNWVFTLNNPQDHGFPRFIKETMIWLRYGEEIAPTTGTPHLQGVVHFKNPRVMPTELYPWCRSAHWEHMGGSIRSNLAYTGKEGSEEKGTLHEFGDRPISNKEAREKGAAATKERYLEIIRLAKEGDWATIESDYPGDYLRSYKAMCGINDRHNGKDQPIAQLEHWWISGPTGCGKTRAVFEAIGGERLYLKDAANIWWCGYNHEDFVLIDDYQPLWKDKGYLKNWADHYPFIAQIKGSSKKIRPKHLIVTSNYSIDDAQFEQRDIDPIKRRFKQVDVQQFISEIKLHI